MLRNRAAISTTKPQLDHRDGPRGMIDCLVKGTAVQKTFISRRTLYYRSAPWDRYVPYATTSPLPVVTPHADRFQLVDPPI